MLTLDNSPVSTSSFDTPIPPLYRSSTTPTPPLLLNALGFLLPVPPPTAEAETAVLSLLATPIPLLHPPSMSRGAYGRLSPSWMDSLVYSLWSLSATICIHGRVFYSYYLFTFLYPLPSLLHFLPLSFYILLFLGIGKWMRFSGMRGSCDTRGNGPDFQYSGYKPVFRCIGMRGICRFCRVEIKRWEKGSALCHASYRGYFGRKDFLLLCPEGEDGGPSINGWVEGLKVKLSLAPGIQP